MRHRELWGIGVGKIKTHQQICSYEDSARARPKFSHDYVSLLLVHVSMLKSKENYFILQKPAYCNVLHIHDGQV